MSVTPTPTRRGDRQRPATARRQDPELVAVPMTDEQQQLFGWLGLNPALLLEDPPEADNVVVRVVKPGEDEQEVLVGCEQLVRAYQMGTPSIVGYSVAERARFLFMLKPRFVLRYTTCF